MPTDDSNSNVKDQVVINSSPKTPLVSVKKIKPDLRKTEPPLVDVKVANPITYIKSWWKRVLGNEGLEIKIKLKPLTAIAITIIVITVTLGIGKFVLPFKIPFFEYTDGVVTNPSPTAVSKTPEQYRQTGFVGELKYNANTAKYYLITTSAETINLSVPENVDFTELLGRRIFATGTYYPDTRVLLVESIEDLEVLPVTQEIVPTASPGPVETPGPTPMTTLEPQTSSEETL